MVRIIWNDIIKEPTDAVVTLASAEPKVGSGVDKFVHAAAGKEEELQKERLAKNSKMVPRERKDEHQDGAGRHYESRVL